ncbi:MAG: hypothetical protein R2684_17360 [Pyrinomonadaceae bacterium]
MKTKLKRVVGFARFDESYASVNWFGSMALALALVFTLASGIFAQEPDELPPGVVPPPLAVVPKDIREKLDAEKDPSDRVKLALGYMDSALAAADASAEKNEYDESLAALGKFRALLQDTMRYLSQYSQASKALKGYKRFEIGLREFIPSLELIRRNMPPSHGYHAEKIIGEVKDARKKSVEKFFGELATD